MPNTGEIRVTGLRELQTAFKRMSKELGKELRTELKEAAEPARALAEQKAASNIRNIGPRWSQMRTGATNRVVYVAPKQRRGDGSPRPNLAGLLMDKAMQPALDESAPVIVERVDALLGRLGTDNGF